MEPFLDIAEGIEDRDALGVPQGVDETLRIAELVGVIGVGALGEQGVGR